MVPVSMTRPRAGCLEALLRDSCEGYKMTGFGAEARTSGVNKQLNPV